MGTQSKTSKNYRSPVNSRFNLKKLTKMFLQGLTLVLKEEESAANLE